MLSKLIKHEFRATARIMLPVMGALTALALLANLSMWGLASGLSDLPLLRTLFILIVVFFGIAMIGTAVMALVIMVSRFYRNLLKDEGYLMLTLPVSVHELIWAKLIVSLVWFLLTALLIILVLFFTGLNLANTNLEMIIAEFPRWSEVRQFLEELGIRGQVMTLVLQGVLVVLLGTLVTCLHFYASMSLGHMFTKNKVFLSIVLFVVISFVFQLMEVGYGIVGFGNLNPDHISEVKDGLKFASTLTWHGIVLCVIQGAVLYLATVLGLKRGLNLE